MFFKLLSLVLVTLGLLVRTLNPVDAQQQLCISNDCTSCQLMCENLNNNQTEPQLARQRWFRAAMAFWYSFSGITQLNNCMIGVLCEVGCTDAIKYGHRDDTPRLVCTDSDYIRQTVNAYRIGQCFGKMVEPNCSFSCDVYKCYSDFIKRLLIFSHNTGMSLFDYYYKNLERLSESEIDSQ